MDHLPYPDNAILPPLKVPYVCKDIEAYDGQGFRDFPSRMGWNESFDGTLRDLGRAQSWLYFGLLGEVFGESFDATDFIDTTAQGDQFVTTRTLKALLQKNCQESSGFYQWATRWGFVDSSMRGVVRGRPNIRPEERIMDIFKLAELQSNILDGGNHLANAIALSIKILVWSIGNALATYLPWRNERGQYVPRHCRLLRGAMLQGGKCPYWTEIYLRLYSPGMIYFLAAMPLPDGRAHHRGCSAQRCIAHDTNDETYIVEHVADCPGCRMTGPDPEKVQRIIEKRSIPLIKIRELPSGRLTLDVVQAGYGVHYTAISHVWSGGLGNPFANTLPQCQLKSIRRGLRLAHEKADADSGLFPWKNRFYKFFFRRKRRHEELFWMDTFCIPVQAGKATRRKAIGQMDFTFAGADNVLVLDPVLRSISRRAVSKLQLRLHVACSVWMTRCWTFQEACLARAWHVALRTNLYEPAVDWHREDNLLFRVMTNQPIWTDQSELEYEALSFYRKLWPLVDQDPQYKTPIMGNDDVRDLAEMVKIWNELDQRSTTRRKDRLIILAILLGLNAGDIVALDVDDQMQAILATQNALPLSFLFEPKHQLPSNSTKPRWIPAYPEGTITTAYGRMTQDRSRRHYQFTLAEIKANGFILDPKYSDLDQGVIKQSLPYAFSAWVKLKPPADSTAPRVTCLILSRRKSITSSLQSPYVGARFSLAPESSSNNDDNDEYTGPQKSYRLIYEGPLIYGRISPTDSSLSPASYPPIEGAVAMPNDAQCLLASDLQQTPPLTHRAQSLHMRHRRGLQSPPYVGLLSGIVLAIWLTAVAIGTTLIELALFHHPATLPADKMAPGGFPLAMVGAVVVRAAVFLGLEAHTLYRIVGERAYERWASSFGGGGGVDAGKLFVRGGRRDEDGVLIQYRPWWVVLVIVVAATAMLVAGTQFAVMVWATVPGAALLLETGVRVGVEVVWVWTPVGRVGRRVRLRWVPWLSIPVRAY